MTVRVWKSSSLFKRYFSTFSTGGAFRGTCTPERSHFDEPQLQYDHKRLSFLTVFLHQDFNHIFVTWFRHYRSVFSVGASQNTGMRNRLCASVLTWSADAVQYCTANLFSLPYRYFRIWRPNDEVGVLYVLYNVTTLPWIRLHSSSSVKLCILMEHGKSQQGSSFHVMKDKYCGHHVTARDVQSRQQSLRIEQS